MVILPFVRWSAAQSLWKPVSARRVLDKIQPAPDVVVRWSVCGDHCGFFCNRGWLALITCLCAVSAGAGEPSCCEYITHLEEEATTRTGMLVHDQLVLFFLCHAPIIAALATRALAWMTPTEEQEGWRLTGMLRTDDIGVKYPSADWRGAFPTGLFYMRTTYLA